MRTPDFWSGGGTPAGRLVAGILSPLGYVYGRCTAARAAKAPEWTAPVPVICVGNAVMGGAGKTQICIDLAQRLSARGHAAHILSRGYGGTVKGPVRVDAAQHGAGDVGDEALLLAAHAPTWVGADRVQSAQAACGAGAGVIIMDDGFQNPSLAKTVSLLAVDAAFGFGNGCVFPAGPLRERPESAMARADAICVVGTGDGTAAFDTALPRFDARIVPAADAPRLAGKKAVAFAGIGHPQKFFRSLGDAGADIVATHSFADHHPYRTDELAPLVRRARELDAVLLTTAKDFVRVPADMKDAVTPFPVALEWVDADGAEAFIIERAGLN